MMAALTVGRYSDASVLTTCSSITVATSPRYGRTYCRSGAGAFRYCRISAPEQKVQVNRRVGATADAAATVHAVTSRCADPR